MSRAKEAETATVNAVIGTNRAAVPGGAQSSNGNCYSILSFSCLYSVLSLDIADTRICL